MCYYLLDIIGKLFIKNIEMKFLKRIIKGIKFRLDTYFLTCFGIFDYLRSNNNIYNEPSICGFFQCYKQPKSAIAMLASFRKIYPTNSIHMFCDNGFDFSHVAEHFGCKYEYLSNKSGKGDTLYFLSKEQVMSYMKRLVYTAQNSTENFLMILEDDFRIYKKIKKLKFDWNCVKPDHHFTGRKLTSLLRARNSSIPWYVSNMYFTGCGGAMLNRAFLVDNFSDGKKLENAVDEVSLYIQKQWGAIPQDAILTALILYFGGTAGMYIGFTEARYWRYRLKPFFGSFDIVHNDKSLYNLPLSEDENKIFLGLN